MVAARSVSGLGSPPVRPWRWERCAAHASPCRFLCLWRQGVALLPGSQWTPPRHLLSSRAPAAPPRPSPSRSVRRSGAHPGWAPMSPGPASLCPRPGLRRSVHALRRVRAVRRPRGRRSGRPEADQNRRRLQTSAPARRGSERLAEQPASAAAGAARYEAGQLQPVAEDRRRWTDRAPPLRRGDISGRPAFPNAQRRSGYT